MLRSEQVLIPAFSEESFFFPNVFRAGAFTLLCLWLLNFSLWLVSAS